MSNYQLRNTIVDLLIRVEKDNGFSHLLIDHELNSKRIDPQDEGLLTEIVYGTIQRKYTIDYYLESFVDPKKKLETWVRILLRMSVYQMIYLDKVPDHAIIHEAVEIAKKRGHKGIASFVNGVLRSMQRKGVPDTASIANDTKRLAIETSHPEWLIERWISFYGFETTKEMCEENISRKYSSIRVQPLKISRDEAIDILNKQGFETRPSIFSDQGIIIDKGNILKTDLFTEGYITVQDQSSMLVAEMLDVTPGMHVLDACSAPGGKATHIAEKLQNQGEVNAYDIQEKKVKQIITKASDLDLLTIDAKTSDARQLQEEHNTESFDRILIDAPCSGLGVIRGKPEIKYDKKESDIKRLSSIQLDILESVAPLLKVDGLLIYSTCTVDMEENEHVVREFLERNPNYIIDKNFFTELPARIQESKGITEYGLQLFPQTFQTDGFFMTRLIRKS
ncbi:16S rRNA (cytosine967-C5)-methyltransferase [Virgibacillus natechei]|uniref:16S rRNA (cytosine(967)-C(5))-methyltransferase n=1 Tax=Virgibacillus natechei TaxID=1216297 RepID=A0ABS4IBX4_9BACI|nr:16S rRNA (cytosine(967)-C(5))-methyltransferase RsmB [Virgibacillus natechei]MBP1968150.1 16S rRNA (cytosine967-C5)-methyltransferase [Virgibacillus natechei]UZD14573.1 16S rRNA (cytosine(967)-C(5))-methyltransferase RsmB [Virgibacillus natechei]